MSFDFVTLDRVWAYCYARANMEMSRVGRHRRLWFLHHTTATHTRPAQAKQPVQPHTKTLFITLFRLHSETVGAVVDRSTIDH